MRSAGCVPDLSGLEACLRVHESRKPRLVGGRFLPRPLDVLPADKLLLHTILLLHIDPVAGNQEDGRAERG